MEVHAGGFLRAREIVLDQALQHNGAELARILAHELFHFVWLRLGNRRRQDWEVVLRNELARKARGELGWSAEWRKARLNPADVSERSRRWREYACESFCDTAAWLWAGNGGHPEFTLKPRFQLDRRRWFQTLACHETAGFRV
ncbi:MAG: hypothetical protein IPP47_14755 [Bryobacterales bacterium]|nr:hypothetical protein [Bryobacterales bacterium]